VTGMFGTFDMSMAAIQAFALSESRGGRTSRAGKSDGL